ncbi:MAG: MFS transporter [Opitutaceae bacterium]|nr:MFS transporter [Opitutaceae bacterium]
MPTWLQPRWRVTAFLVIASALNYADRAAFSTVLPVVRSEFDLTDTQLGLIGSVFLWSYALASPFSGSLADRYSRRGLVLVSLLLWSAVTGLTGLAGGLTTLLVLRMALGLTESPFIPSAVALSADHHGVATRARAISLLPIGMNLGVVIGGVGVGFLADHFGWRAGFWVLGLFGMVFALAGQPLLTDGPNALAARAAKRSGAGLGEALGYLFRTPSYCLLLGGAMLVSISSWVFLSWLPLYFRESFNLSLAESGLVGTVMLQGTTVIGNLAGGWLSDVMAVRERRRRMLLIGLCFLGSAPFLLLFLLQPGYGLAVAAVGLFSVVIGLATPNEHPILCEVVPERFRSTAVGIMNTSASLAGGIGVFLTGVFKSTMGLNLVFALLTIVLVIPGLGHLCSYWFFARRDIARAEAHGAEPAAR